MSHRLIVAVALLSLSSIAAAEGPRIQMPEFAHLQSKATDAVNVTIGPLPLAISRWFMRDDDPDSAAVKGMLKGVKSVNVRHYEFAEDFVYSQSDLDAVRSQLSGKGWSSLAQVRDKLKNEDVDVYVAMDKDEITGFTIVASEPREFTIVNIVGTLDMAQVQAFRKQMEKSGFVRL
jgi:hypothetical protein